jgi:hypothetical protein
VRRYISPSATSSARRGRFAFPAAAVAVAATRECEYSRNRDGVEVNVLTELPADYVSKGPRTDPWEDTHSCAGGPRRCPPCPASPWVILADLVISGGVIVDPVGDTHRRYVAAFGNYSFSCPPGG